MPNLLDEICAGRVPIADDLHTLICLTCEEMAGSDEVKRLALHEALVTCITQALLGECGEPLTYDPSFIADYVSGVSGPRR